MRTISAVDELAQLRRIVEALAARVGEIETRIQPSDRLSRADRALLVTLLPVLAEVTGGECFLARELVEASDDRVRRVLGGRSPRTIGRLLRRAEGVAVDNYCVESHGHELGLR